MIIPYVIRIPWCTNRFHRVGLLESAALRGGKFHLKLNMDERPIANKYCEGKMKRTLKRESKVLEIVRREAIDASRSTKWKARGAWISC